MARKKIANVAVDPRTGTMSAATLECRADRHALNRVPMGPKRRAELAALGQVEKHMVCTRPGCSYSRTSVYDVRERVQVSSKTTYGEGYLMGREHAGTGRLLSLDAFIALLDRTGEL